MRRVLLAVVILLAGSLPSFAHHSTTAEFDVAHRMTLSGTLTKVDWVNPHIVVLDQRSQNIAARLFAAVRNASDAQTQQMQPIALGHALLESRHRSSGEKHQAICVSQALDVRPKTAQIGT